MSPSERIQLQKKTIKLSLCSYIYKTPNPRQTTKRLTTLTLTLFYPNYSPAKNYPKTTQKQPQIRPRNQG